MHHVHPDPGLPSPHETSKIITLITEQEKNIRLLEDRAKQLQDRIECLKAGKDNSIKEIEFRRAFIAPIRRLHPEILQEVFGHCLPTAHQVVMCSHEAPMLLGHVCRYWRHLSREFPSLWTSIHIVIPPQNPYPLVPKGPPLQEISAWLKRSGVLPLSISLSSTYPPITPTDSIDPTHALYLDAISAFKSRWKSIWINIPTFDWPSHFFCTTRATDVPLLEKLHIQSLRILDPTPVVYQPTFNLFTLTREDSILHAPRLRSISILPCGSELLQLSLHWEAIIELNLSWNTFHYFDVIKALKLCPNLETCIISSVDRTNMDATSEIVELVLPRLISLTLIDESDTESDLSRLLKGLRAPHLRHLSYERRPYWPPPGIGGYRINDTIDALGAFLGSLINPLEEMELVTESLLHEDVMRLLKLVPGIKRLVLEGFGRWEGDDTWVYHPDLNQVFVFKSFVLRKLIPGHSAAHSLLTRHTATNSVDGSSDGDDSDDGNDDEQHGVDDTETPPVLLQSSDDVLCPRLEVVDFSGCMFSDTAMINFLKSRTLHHQKHNVARLRKASISFARGKEQVSGTVQEIEILEQEAQLSLSVSRQKHWQPTSRSMRAYYSPYDGLEPTPSNDSSGYQYKQGGYLGFG